MRRCHLLYSCLTAMTLAAPPLHAQAPQPQPSQQQQPMPAPTPPKPYTPVAVAAPPPFNDAGFIALRQQLASIAEKRDRAGLQKLIVQKGFFWEGESGDKADKQKSNFDNFAAAIHLDDADGTGWEILAGAAQEPTAEPDEDRKGVMCGPASPKIDEQQFAALMKDTGTDADEWGFPARDGLEVRATAKDDSPVVGKLGMNLVRVFPDDTNNTTEPITNVRVVTPSGKLGYVPVAAVLPIVSDQVCYSKEAGGWKITGYAGGQ